MKSSMRLFLVGMLLASGQALAQLPTISLDNLMDWKEPRTFTLDQMKKFCAAQPALQKADTLRVEKATEVQIIALLGTSSDGFVMKVGTQGLLVTRVMASFNSTSYGFLKLYFDPQAPDQADLGLKIVHDLGELAGGDPPEFQKGQTVVPVRNAATGKIEQALRDAERFQWLRSGWHMVLERSKKSSGLWGGWTFMNHTGTPIPLAVRGVLSDADGPERPPEIKADLDPLLDFSTIWKTTAEQFGKKYVARDGEIKKDQPVPQFEWLTATKDRARFSRQMFADAPATLTLFGAAVKVEEAVVEFVNGNAGRASISIYNRGDAGQMENTAFQALFKKVGQSLGEALKVAPRRQMSAGTGAVKNVAWMWTSPLGVALLEHNDFQSQGTMGKPEYLRLKLAAPDQADWTMGRMSMGVQRMALQKNVTKDAASGDVFINGVPMVDQGAKGYCVAASCQRLFEYMRIPCDQHEMAQLLSVGVDSGADVMVMQKSLAKVDQKFGVAFRPLVNPEQYYSSYMKRKVSLKEFASIVKEHADKGIPLLWGLELGQVPEDPPLPGGGQVRGGHMRMIIGYNTQKNQIIFTDSWGAGHEKKRMDATNAYNVTLGLYSMSPRGM